MRGFARLRKTPASEPLTLARHSGSLDLSPHRSLMFPTSVTLYLTELGNARVQRGEVKQKEKEAERRQAHVS